MALFVIEGGLRLAGYGHPTGFFLTRKTADGTRILTTNPQFGWRFFPPEIARTPRPLAVPVRQTERTCRIFVLGESAAYGDPAPAFGLPRMLEVLLAERHPGTRFEVINAAMTAINSHVLLPIARDCAKHDGDIWLLYVGNNEVVGPYGGGTVFGPQTPPLPFIRANLAFKATRLGQLLSASQQKLGQGKTTNTAGTVSMELFLDQQLRADDPRMPKVYAHFARNLADIIATGTASGAKVVVSTVAVNLKDCAPFGSLNQLGMAAAQQEEWNTYWQAGIKAEAARDWPVALTAYRQAERLDGRHAELQFRLARGCLQPGQFAEARKHFAQARDYDTLRFRADGRINEIIRQTANNRAAADVVLVDGEAALANRSPHQIIGGEFLHEHVHFNFAGNYFLALALAEQIEKLLPAGLASTAPKPWPSESDCARTLDLNAWDRLETASILCRRYERPPFTRQLDYQLTCDRLKQERDTFQAQLTPINLKITTDATRLALARRPQDWVLQQKLAQLLSRSEDKDLAIDAWRKVIDQLPDYADARQQVAELLLQIGRANAALGEWQNVARWRPHDASAWHGLGRACAALSRRSEAIQNFEQALRLKPDFPEALVELGRILQLVGRTDEAMDRFAEALRLNPGDLEASLALGQLRDQKGDLTEIARRYQEALHNDPSNAVVHYQLGRIYRQLGNLNNARSNYARAVQLRPDFAEAHCQLGFELALDGNSADAMTHFNEAIRLKPDFTVAHLNLGVALARQKKYSEAAARFETVLRLNPANSEAQKYLAEIRKAQGK